MRTMRDYLHEWSTASQRTIRAPRKFSRLICFKIIHSCVFKSFVYSVILTKIALGLNLIIYHWFYKIEVISLVAAGFCLFVFLVFLIEFWLTILAYSTIGICRHGFRTYFR